MIKYLQSLVLLIAISIGLMSLGGCYGLTNHKGLISKKHYEQTAGPIVQQATLKTKKQQLGAIEYAHEFTRFDSYKHDDKQLEDGDRIAGKSKYDYWSTDKYAKVKALRKAVESGAKDAIAKLGYDDVSVDCDDSAIMLYMALVDLGYPRDQLYFNYYLVPPSNMAGISGKEYGGHCVLTIDVEDSKPISIEDMFPHYKDYSGKINKTLWRYVSDIERDGRYYCVGQHRNDFDIRTHWYFIDFKGYQKFSKGHLSFDESTQTRGYLKHRKYTLTKFHRGDYE